MTTSSTSPSGWISRLTPILTIVSLRASKRKACVCPCSLRRSLRCSSVFGAIRPIRTLSAEKNTGAMPSVSDGAWLLYDRPPALPVAWVSTALFIAGGHGLISAVHRRCLWSAANRGHFSATYFSAASRTTHATDTLFCRAIPCSVSYSSGGKLTDARCDADDLRVFCLFIPSIAQLSLSFGCTTIHQSGAPGQEEPEEHAELAPVARPASPEERDAVGPRECCRSRTCPPAKRARC